MLVRWQCRYVMGLAHYNRSRSWKEVMVVAAILSGNPSQEIDFQIFLWSSPSSSKQETLLYFSFHICLPAYQTSYRFNILWRLSISLSLSASFNSFSFFIRPSCTSEDGFIRQSTSIWLFKVWTFISFLCWHLSTVGQRRPRGKGQNEWTLVRNQNAS